MTVAATDATFASELAQRLSGMNFRAYTSTDIIGVEVGGAVKNVLAIGAGISDGLGFGANTRIALITRGLVEMTRLGVALGARKETFMGLAGLGDLVLTCTDNQSRNRRFGLALAAGESVDAAQKAIGQVVEGVQAARAVREVAARAAWRCRSANRCTASSTRARRPKDAVKELMSRALKPERRVRPRTCGSGSESSDYPEVRAAATLRRPRPRRIRQVQAAIARAHRNAQTLRPADTPRAPPAASPRVSGPNTNASPAA